MLIGVLIAVVVVLGVLAVVLMTRRSHDDVHSVEHYHRQLHTLEEMRTHTGGDGRNGAAGASRTTGATGAGAAGATGAVGTSGGSTDAGAQAGTTFPASAVRVSGSSTVRLTEPGTAAPVPPVPPPLVPNPSEPLSFDDAGPEPVPTTFMTGNEDRVIHSINRRPRRLGGPAAAVGAVLVLVVVLILTGLHSNTDKHHHGKTASAATSQTTVPAPKHHRLAPTSTTTTTTAPPVSAATAVTPHTATYTVATSDYSLAIAATTGECWVEVTDTTTGAVLFTTTLLAGQFHAVSATGPVSVIAGAPGAFSATVNGARVTLPVGNQAPFTLNFQTPGSTPSGSTTTTLASSNTGSGPAPAAG